MKETLIRIQLTLDYIEDNLKAEITPQELSALAGFSLCHYYHLFTQTVGMSLGQYVNGRRLRWAIYEIGEGRNILDVALEYGFETHAGFYRAFYREYGCSPTAYLKRHRPVKPYPIRPDQEGKLLFSIKNARKLLAAWGFEKYKIQDIYYEGSGQVSEHDFQVGEEWVLKLSPSPGRLNRHVELSLALEREGLAASVPVPVMENGREYLAQEGELFGILCGRIQGERMKGRELWEQSGKEMESNRACAFGALIGRPHGILARLDCSLCEESDLYGEVLSWALPAVQRKIEEMDKGLRKKTDMFQPESFTAEYIKGFGGLHRKLPRQIVHRDMNPCHVICRGGKMAGFTDFELSQINLRLFDPCYAATGILTENLEKGLTVERWIPLYHDILRGYDREAYLTAEERQAAPWVVLSIQLICTAYFSEKEKYTRLAQINMHILKELIRKREQLVPDERTEKVFIKERRLWK